MPEPMVNRDSLKFIEDAWVRLLIDFRAWLIPETSKLEKWKSYPIEKAIRACRARLVDDAEAMLAEWRKATSEEVDIGETATLPILLTALAPIQTPPDVNQVKSTSAFVEVAINNQVVRLRTIRTAIRCQTVFFSTNVHDTKAFIDQFQAYLDDDIKRRIDVAYKINQQAIPSFKMTVLENSLFPDNIISEAKNIDIVSIDCVLLGVIPQVLGLGAGYDNNTGNGSDNTGTPINKPQQHGLVVVQADATDLEHVRITADPETGEITQEVIPE